MWFWFLTPTSNSQSQSMLQQRRWEREYRRCRQWPAQESKEDFSCIWWMQCIQESLICFIYFKLAVALTGQGRTCPNCTKSFQPHCLDIPNWVLVIWDNSTWWPEHVGPTNAPFKGTNTMMMLTLCSWTRLFIPKNKSVG